MKATRFDPSTDLSQTLDDRFLSRLRDAPTGCLEWTAETTRDGYGRYWHEGRRVSAHRFAWEQVNGPIPDGLLLCHECDNPPCCNPNHLFLGTQSDNIRDAVAKGRQRSISRTHCPHGHAYDVENTYRRPDGGRKCRTCNRERERRRRSQPDL